MIEKIAGIPPHVAGFVASGEVTKQDYDDVIVPEIERVVKQHGHIHFLLVLDTGVGDFTAGAWWSDAMIGLKHYTQWKKMAIVSDQKGVEKFTNIFGVLIPGKSKAFTLDETEEAKKWVSTEG